MLVSHKFMWNSPMFCFTATLNRIGTMLPPCGGNFN